MASLVLTATTWMKTDASSQPSTQARTSATARSTLRVGRDFISKCCIGLKEGREAHVRLRLCEANGIGPTEEARALRIESNEIVSILGAIVRNTRRNAGITTAGRTRVRIPHS